MKRVLTFLLCVIMILSFGACSSGEKTDPDKPITLTPENIEQYIKIDTDVISKLSDLANGYYNSYLMKLSSASTKYHFDDTTIKVMVYTTDSDFRGEYGRYRKTIDNKDCWMVDCKTIEFNGENPSETLTFESVFSDNEAHPISYFYVIEDVSGMVSILRN